VAARRQHDQSHILQAYRTLGELGPAPLAGPGFITWHIGRHLKPAVHLGKDFIAVLVPGRFAHLARDHSGELAYTCRLRHILMIEFEFEFEFQD